MQGLPQARAAVPAGPCDVPVGTHEQCVGGRLGGRIGSGRQAFPWISLDDEVGAMRFLLEHDEVTGPVNLAGPEPASNAQFTSALAEVLHRPAPFVVPGAVLRAVLGQLAEELVLTGPFVVPAVLQKHGYGFRHLTIREALQAAVERP